MLLMPLILYRSTGDVAITSVVISSVEMLLAFFFPDIMMIGTKTSSGVAPPCAPKPIGVLLVKELWVNAHIVLPSSNTRYLLSLGALPCTHSPHLPEWSLSIFTKFMPLANCDK